MDHIGRQIQIVQYLYYLTTIASSLSARRRWSRIGSRMRSFSLSIPRARITVRTSTTRLALFAAQKIIDAWHDILLCVTGSATAAQRRRGRLYISSLVLYTRTHAPRFSTYNCVKSTATATTVVRGLGRRLIVVTRRISTLLSVLLLLVWVWRRCRLWWRRRGLSGARWTGGLVALDDLFHLIDRVRRKNGFFSPNTQ